MIFEHSSIQNCFRYVILSVSKSSFCILFNRKVNGLLIAYLIYSYDDDDNDGYILYIYLVRRR